MKSNPGSQNIKEPSSLERTVKRFIDWGFFSKDAWLMHLILPIIFIVLMILFHPFRETFQTDTDEGINLIKAVLVMEGHQITGDIETDQPPLLSNLLAMVFRWTGQSVNVARLVVLLFSGVLLGAAGMSSQTAWNRGTGLLVYLMLILLPNYLLLSVSVMIGQPSIALAMVSLLCIFMWHRCRKWPWLVLAGLFISLSLFTKIFTAILLPVFGVGLLVAEWTILQDNTKKTLQKRWIQILKPAFIFSLSVIGISAILAVTLLELENVMILFLPHLTYRSLTSVTGSITADLKSAALPIILATIGLGFSIVKRKWLALYPAAWAIIAYLSLLNHNPIWWHHQMLVTIPAALLSAYGVFSITKGFWELNQVHNLWHKALIFGGLLIIGAMSNERIRATELELRDRHPSFHSYGLDPNSGDMRILSKMNSLAEEGTLIVTDMPMFAVRAKMQVPTELAWVSDKRFRTGYITEGDFINLIEREKPALVLIARYPLHDVRAFLEGNPDYDEVINTKIHTEKRATLYYRKQR